MPYIEQDKRDEIRPGLVEATATIYTPGELNFALSTLCHIYISRHGGLRYTTINEVIGVLECAKLELYRKLAGPYEDRKLNENGPVSDLEKTAANA